MLGELNRQRPDTTRSCVHQHRLTGREPRTVPQYVPRRQPLDQQRERLPITHSVRYVDHPVHRRDGVFGVPTAGREDGGEHPATVLGPADDLDAGNEGECDAAAVRAVGAMRVGEVHARRTDLDQELAGSGDRSVEFGRDQDLGTAELGDLNGAHEDPFSRGTIVAA